MLMVESNHEEAMSFHQRESYHQSSNFSSSQGIAFDKHKGLMNQFSYPQLSIDDFKIITVLGKGSNATVYLADDCSGNRVAIRKVLKARDDRRERQAIRIHTQLRIFQTVQDRIPQLYGFFQSEDSCYFVVEYLPGDSLANRLQKEGCPSDTQLQFLLPDIADAVAHFHQYGIVPRDLKCENIAFDSNNRARLIDFEYGLFISEIDRDEHRCGTFALLAPELLLSNSISFANDWWCVGQVAYYAKFEHLPFCSLNLHRVKSMILNANPMIWKSTPAELSSFICGLLAKVPAMRIGSPGNDPKSHAYFEAFDWASLKCDSENDGSEPPKRAALSVNDRWIDSVLQV
jgi:serine/threonine protein kinase